MTQPAIDGIVLAAGAATRFGSDKRLLLINGVPMLQCSLAVVTPAVRDLWVVLRAVDRGQLPALLGPWQQHPALRLLLLDQPDSGMGANLAHAVRALPEDTAGVLVALGDMPFLRPATVQALVAAFQPGRIVMPVHAGQRGHPVLFPKTRFADLAALSGDVGARSVLEACPADRLTVLVNDPGVLRDIDEPQDVDQQAG